MHLLDTVTNLKCPDEQVLFYDSRAAISKADLVSSINHGRDRFRHLHGKSVALKISDRLALGTTLAIFDGLVSRMVLIPPETDNETTQVFLNDSCSDVLITNPDDLQMVSGDSAAIPSIHELLETEWVLTTSGTTASPKLVKHSLLSLTKTARPGKPGAGFRWGLTYAMERFAGLQVYLQAMISGSSLVFTDRNATLEETVATFVRHDVNSISATPSLWRKFLMTPGLEQLALKTITLGGEIADQAVLGALRNRFPDAHVQHIYASTEAGVGFSVTDGLAGFPVSYLDGGIDGGQLRISDHGTLLIRSMARANSYIGREDLSVNDDGYFDTGDLIELTGDRCYFRGRHNGAINVGGNKVQPELVESVLHELDEVAMASVSAFRSSIVGNLVRARIVPTRPMVKADQNAFSKRIKQHCGERLEKYMVPALIDFVDEIETGSTGKVAR